MERYWLNRSTIVRSAVPSDTTPPHEATTTSRLSEFDRLRQALVRQEEQVVETWSAELRRYLKDMPADVSKNTDIVKWWQASFFFSLRSVAYRTDIMYFRITARPFLSSRGSLWTFWLAKRPPSLARDCFLVASRQRLIAVPVLVIRGLKNYR